MIQPDVRRHASSTSSTKAVPNTTSAFEGVVLRSQKSSPPCSRYTIVATPTAAQATSHHIRRLRYRAAIGKSRKTSSRMNPTCTGRSTCAGTISSAAYMWKTLITTSRNVVRCPSQPRNRLTAPSSSSMKASARLSCSSVTVPSPAAASPFASAPIVRRVRRVPPDCGWSWKRRGDHPCRRAVSVIAP